ncbi:MAG: hypothetical protein AAGC81_19120 [Pseudomonadota bacterium]
MTEDIYESAYKVTVYREKGSGRIVGEVWRNSDDQLDRPGDLPARTEYDLETGSKTFSWYQDGKLHRDGGQPARMMLDQTGAPFSESWWEHGLLHRDQNAGPAHILSNPHSGHLSMIEYKWRGAYHRTDGPALIRYNKNGHVYRREYWVNGQHTDPPNSPAPPDLG